MSEQEQPYSEWMEELELACEFGWDQEERERALRELHQRDEELERLRAQVTGLNEEAEALHKILVEHLIVDA